VATGPGHRGGRRCAALVSVVLGLTLVAAGCGGSGGEEEGTPPAVSEQVEGSDAVRVVMTAEAAKRIGVKLATVARDPAGDGETVIPYEAVLYDPDGATWTYTSPKPNVFQRTEIDIARIDGDSAFLEEGPPAGVRVVTVGATEIWGVEYGGIEED
jgi:hypothetical protein